MRLTLRTLLAWLDDTLTPAEVRAIGKQVAESDFAKELVDRIHKVTRQRRLTVPPWTGPEGVDPNLVSAYLDNELDADSVAEFEKKCLTSDVHLAEVASVHQVLSLIGQKAKVPLEARERMYQLIKGRESTRPDPMLTSSRPRSRKPLVSEVAHAKAIEPAKGQPNEAPLTRSLTERYGPFAGVVALVLVLFLSAIASMRGPDRESSAQNKTKRGAAADKAKGKGELPPNANPGPELLVAKAERNDVKPPADSGKGSASVVEEPKTVKEGPAVPPAAKPERTFAEGAVAETDKPSGLLLRYRAKDRDWERLFEPTPLKAGERLLSLEPFRSVFNTAKANVELNGQTEVILRETSSELAAKCDLVFGKLSVAGTDPPRSFEVSIGGTTVSFQPRAGQFVGIERLIQRQAGSAKPLPVVLQFWSSEGPLALKTAEGAEATVNGPGSIRLELPGQWSEPSETPVPDWVKRTPPAAESLKAGQNFLTLFRQDRPLVPSLVEAIEDDNPESCRLAIHALSAIGDISYLVPTLNRDSGKTAAIARRTAISALRDSMAISPDHTKSIRDELTSALGPEAGALTWQLLVGFPEAERQDPQLLHRLVQTLERPDSADIGLRELALDNLKTATGEKGDLGYDAGQPEGEGLSAWKKVVTEKRAKAAEPAAKKKAK